MTETPNAAPPKKSSMLKKILIGLVVVIAGFAAVVALQPADYVITRKATIAAPPAAVFARVNDFHLWEAWSPWEKLDPAMKKTFQGPPAGTGTIYAWTGNDKVGEGRMTLIESRPSDLIRIKLDFIKPLEDTSTTEFAFKGDAKGTEVTWSMSGHKNFISKAFCMFMSVDKMVGGDFEKGLAALKSVVEAPPGK